MSAFPVRARACSAGPPASNPLCLRASVAILDHRGSGSAGERVPVWVREMTPRHGAQRTPIRKIASVISVPLWLRTLIVIAAAQTVLSAHSGPPFPILSDQIAGAYRISIWADPDATDDGSAAGQFWVMLQPARPGAGPAIPADTRIEVQIRPLDRPGAAQSGRAAPVNADPARQFVALLMDHEGPFGVRVTVDGPLGAADAQASTDATYDLRPRPILLVLFVLPFVLVGFVWGKLLIRRRMQRPGGR